MHRQFGIEAPAGVLSKYEDLFNSKNIFFTHSLPRENPTNVVLEDSNDVYIDEGGWVASVSTVISHISAEEMLCVTNQGGKITLLWKK